jgi:hypothetical protein
MKTQTLQKRILTLAACFVLAQATPIFAVEDLKLTIHCPDVVLSWPSVVGESYIVQHRETLSTNTPWVTLTNALFAEWGTNITTYTHANRVDCPPGLAFGMMSLSAGGSETLSLASSPMTLAERAAIKQAREEARIAALLEKCALEGREPYEWELKHQPPLPPSPEEVRAKILAARESRLAGGAAEFPSQEANFDNGNDPQPAEGGSEVEPGCGFYRVVREGIQLYGLTNGMVVSGVINVPIEYSLSSTDQLLGFNLYADGNPLIGVESNDTNEFRRLTWDTRMILNGTYNLNAEANFLTDESVTNPPVTVTVSNVISFPNFFTRIFGDWMWVHAQSTVYPADYQIAMYADDTNYLGAFSGTTANGTISFIWDLTDGNGYPLSQETFRAEFYLTGTGAGASGPNDPLPGPVPVPPATNSFAKDQIWEGKGKFVVAYSAADNNSAKTLKIRSMVIGGIIGAEYGGVVSTLSLAGGGAYNLSPGNVYGSAAFELADAATRTQLLGYLADPPYRNFYFFGHGHKRGIAGVTPASLIMDQDIVHALKNFLTAAKPVNKHPYRLVFIDGCATGSGNFCESFGIPPQALSNQYFINAGVRSRAFLGFKGNVPFNEQQWAERSLQLSYFFGDWQQTLPLEVCISNVVNGTYQQTQTLPNHWVIYGAKDLQINSF